MYAGLTVNFSAMINVFVFYTINSEYREVIKRMFGTRKFTTKVNDISTMHGMADSTSRRKSSATTRSATTHY
ncbi:hypothetical protein OESDEN_25044 [Oesophagostomum dentatum]|uniref:Uncharacterized protein n=1 Tax=Oesophagostomum dentatum TaxID=61180 RepID=A0A0B1RWB9_OESDE|nr:hypothetical protein OESDEN_25044 [Oesophagostomum dentatum]